MNDPHEIPFDSIRDFVDRGRCPADPDWLDRAIAVSDRHRARNLQLAQSTKRPRTREQAAAAARDAHRINTALRALRS